jgi:hypothetical protein
MAGESAKPRGQTGPGKYDATRQGANGAALMVQPKAYNADADVVVPDSDKKEKKKKKVRIEVGSLGG